jgi:hypothetical protein
MAGWTMWKTSCINIFSGHFRYLNCSYYTISNHIFWAHPLKYTLHIPYIWYLQFRYLTSALISALISWRSVNSPWHRKGFYPMAPPSPWPKPSPLNQI